MLPFLSGSQREKFSFEKHWFAAGPKSPGFLLEMGLCKRSPV
jgi:hypothetical protein